MAAEWIPGTVHRGAEKLFESRDYRQILMLVDRHDWLSAFCSEIGVVVGVERALGLTPPERAQHLRILLCELTRIAHHLAFLAPLPGALPDAWRAQAWGWRGEILDLIEAATGHRVHPMFCQVGGVRADVSDEWVSRVSGAAAAWSAPEPGAALAALDSPDLAAVLDSSYAGVAVLSAAQALGFGASGPVARASGVDLDLRRDDPYLPYPAFEVPTGEEGDARARVRMLVDELAPSIGAGGVGGRAAGGLDGGTGGRTAAQGRARPRGLDLHLDGESHGDQRLPAGVAQRPDAVAAEAAQRRIRQRRRDGSGTRGDCRDRPAGGDRQLPDRLWGRRPLKPDLGGTQRSGCSRR